MGNINPLIGQTLSGGHGNNDTFPFIVAGVIILLIGLIVALGVLIDYWYKSSLKDVENIQKKGQEELLKRIDELEKKLEEKSSKNDK